MCCGPLHMVNHDLLINTVFRVTIPAVVTSETSYVFLREEHNLYFIIYSHRFCPLYSTAWHKEEKKKSLL